MYKKTFIPVLCMLLLGSSFIAIVGKQETKAHVIRQKIKARMDRLIALDDTGQREMEDLEEQWKKALQEVRERLEACIKHFEPKKLDV